MGVGLVRVRRGGGAQHLTAVFTSRLRKAPARILNLASISSLARSRALACDPTPPPPPHDVAMVARPHPEFCVAQVLRRQ